MARRIVAVMLALFWAICGSVGFELLSHLAQRGVPGFPKAGQWDLYVIVPAAMMLFGVVLAIVAKRVSTVLYVALLIVEAVPILPLLVIYGGGV